MAYKEVRSLTRGLDVLKALNGFPGGYASITDVATACGMHRTTAKRMLETLCRNGVVRPGEREGQYYLTFEARRLSEGFIDEAWVEQVARPIMRASVAELMWPCDLATLEGGDMVVRESTHRWSVLSQQHAMIGERMPVFQTATGRAYFAFSPAPEQAALLQLLRSRGLPQDHLASDARQVRRLVQSTLKRGFGLNEGEWRLNPRFSGIAVPVYSGQRLIAALNMGYPNGSVPMPLLRNRFAPLLRKLAASIGKGSQPWFDV